MYHATHSPGSAGRLPHQLQQRPPPSSHGMRDFNDDNMFQHHRNNSMGNSRPNGMPLMNGDFGNFKPGPNMSGLPSPGKSRPMPHPNGPSPAYEEFSPTDREATARAAATERQNRRHRYRRGNSQEQLQQNLDREAREADEQLRIAIERGSIDQPVQLAQPVPRTSPTAPRHDVHSGAPGPSGSNSSARRPAPQQQRQASISRDQPLNHGPPVTGSGSRSEARRGSESEPEAKPPGSSITRTPSRGVVASVLQPLGRKCDEYDGLMLAAQADMARLDAELRALQEQREQAEGRFAAAKAKHDEYRRQYLDVERALRGEEDQPPLPVEPLMGMPSRQVSRSGPFDRSMSFQEVGGESDLDDDDDDDLDEPVEERPRPRHVFGEKKAGPMERFRKSFFGGS